MANTTNLVLPLIAGNQDQKHVTHNDSLRTLDAVVQLSVIDRDLTAPPGSPSDGDRYIPAIGATGAWAGWDLNIAAYQDGAWVNYVPKEGWLAWVTDENITLIYDNSSWKISGKTSPGGEANPLSSLIFNPSVNGSSIWRSDTARSGIPRTAIIQSIASDIITLTTTTSSDFFNDSHMLGVSYIQIHNTTKTPDETAWVKAGPANNQLQVVTAADISGWAATDVIQLGDPTKATNVFAVDISPAMQAQLGAVFRLSGVMCKLEISATSALSPQIGITPSGAIGSFMNENTFPDGSLNNGLVIVPTSILSPISNSNLVYVRESDAGVGTLLVGNVSIFGFYA